MPVAVDLLGLGEWVHAGDDVDDILDRGSRPCRRLNFVGGNARGQARQRQKGRHVALFSGHRFRTTPSPSDSGALEMFVGRETGADYVG